MMATAIPAGVPAEHQVAVAALVPPETLDAGGLQRAVTWRLPAGASEVRVDSASLRIAPTTGGPGRNVGQVSGRRSGTTELTLTVPGGPGRIRRLHLQGLEHAGTPLRSATDLDDLRLVVAPVIGGQVQAPVVAVPALGPVNALPAQLVGGSFSDGVLRLPDVAAATVRLTLVRGGAPEDFLPEPFDIERVTLWVAPQPGDLEVADGTGATQWSVPGPLTTTAGVDLRAAVERHLTAALPDGPLQTHARVSAGATGSAAVMLSVTGAVVRAPSGRIPVELEGRARDLPVGPPSLEPRAPWSVTADVGVTHHGMGLHPVSDPVPGAAGGLGGPLVGDVAVVRALPPEALVGFQVRRLGVVGWPVGPTELVVGLVRLRAGAGGAPAPAATEPPGAATSLEGRAGTSPPELVWVELPSPSTPAGGVGVAVTAVRGRFRWVAAPHPLVLVAVTTLPEGRQVRIGATTLDLTGSDTVLTGVPLVPADFAGQAPSVASDQFVTVTVSNLRLEYQP